MSRPQQGLAADYAARLTAKKQKGKCGLPEVEDTGRKLERQLNRLCDLVKASSHLVVLVGAGISTSAGVPDFRGPQGIWTQEAAGKESSGRKRPRAEEGAAAGAASAQEGTAAPADSVELSKVEPTYTHHALTELARRGVLKTLITQNIDGLELRAGYPRDGLAIIHGCACEERCAQCGARVLHADDVGGTKGAPTGRTCEAPRAPLDEPRSKVEEAAGAEAGATAAAGGVCGGAMCATLLDWDDTWPADQAALADGAVAAADLCICLGTSLRVEPAGSLPNLAKSFAVVNLQPTPKDRATKCELIVRAKCDTVMRRLVRQVCGVELDTAADGAIEWREW